MMRRSESEAVRVVVQKKMGGKSGRRRLKRKLLDTIDSDIKTAEVSIGDVGAFVSDGNVGKL